MTEVKRDSRTSTFEVSSSTAEADWELAWYLIAGYYEVAKARGAKSFVGLKAWRDADGRRMYLAGFADTARPSVQDEFGDEYAPIDETGVPRAFMSVVDYEHLLAHADYYRD